ncbi:bifunctional 5,10-methylenetetrahydrofolate dehydrogenase/5,10-methenyltetrahydrofolate cyclohydrolase [Candidatus Actinomarina]|jgi:methylenetetrahydrofolate dehydrogenase (NADP+)/methenyltetrahydrofolate cyclohydrolase|nr:bifunctional 5,10-methylenetetrahydrofolate dehydrogenase/5,10-methenyltetrahydrofolate cyclohydrolase [Candidatus Actinomarina sp.]
MEKILLGKPVADYLDKNSHKIISEYTSKFKKQPTLTAITVGDNPASLLYVSRKEDKAKELGVTFNWIKLSQDSSYGEVLDVIEKSKTISQGIIIQLPLPGQFNFEEIVNLIPPDLDVDGLSTHNLGYLFSSTPNVIPATSLAILELLKFYDIETEDKNIVIAGRSRLVSSPLSKLLSSKMYNANVTVVHSKTTNLKNYINQADIFISAIGKGKIFNKSFFKEQAVIIDVGISRVGEKNLGDIDPTNLEDYVVARSPFPGGVGPITVSALFSNLAELIK